MFSYNTIILRRCRHSRFDLNFGANIIYYKIYECDEQKHCLDEDLNFILFSMPKWSKGKRKQGGEITLDVFQIPVIYYLPCFVVGCLKARHMIIMIFVNDLYMYFMKCK